MRLFAACFSAVGGGSSCSSGGHLRHLTTAATCHLNLLLANQSTSAVSYFTSQSFCGLCSEVVVSTGHFTKINNTTIIGVTILEVPSRIVYASRIKEFETIWAC